MLWLLRFLKGFLIIEISGENTERLLNIAAKNRILLWNLKFVKGKIVGCIKIVDFYRIRHLRHECGVKIKIKEKHGLPFKTVRFRKRTGLLVGGAFFLIILKFLSLHIWCVEIEGNTTISNEKIYTACNSIGIELGKTVKDIEPTEAAQKLLMSVPELAWASINIEGCKATINITEIKNIGEDTSIATNIIAAFDGEIKKIDVTSGTVCVKVGDIVKQGDLLVSGVKTTGNDNVFVHSSGIITAKTRRIYTVEDVFLQTKTVPNGNFDKKSVLSFFSLDVPLYLGDSKPPYNSKTKIKQLKLFGVKMPIFITTKTFDYCDKVTFKFSESDLTEYLKEKTKNKICEDGVLEYNIIEENIIVGEKGIKIETIIETMENIALQKPIILNR